jgi:GTP-binding protein Era
MIELTYDPDARTLYAYFTEIDEGQDSDQREMNGYFLLDKAGHILGMHVELGNDYQPRLLHFALEHDEVDYDQRGGSMRISFLATPPDGHSDFPYPAIVDLDRNGHALGIEFAFDPEFAVENRLQHVQPFIVQIFGDEDEETPNVAASFPDLQEEDDIEIDTFEPAMVPEGTMVPDGPLETPPWSASMDAEIVRSGFVALVGKPNVGKSTLLNAYLNMKVSIVSPKPQTTRVAVRGILNREDAQVVFIDTPGMHQPKSRLGEYMVESARRSIPDADVVCFIVDATEGPTAQDRRIAEIVKHSHKPTILVLNKVDVAHHADAVLEQYRELGPWESETAVSAKLNAGLETLLERIITYLPEGPRLFPADQVTNLSEREQVAELVREKVLLNTQQEVPHGVAVEVEEWEMRGERLYIRATVNVERESHKGIIIGEGGQMLKKIGAAARYEIERLLNRPIYLDLWIKVRRDWRSDPTSLRWLGYDIKKLG